MRSASVRTWLASLIVLNIKLATTISDQLEQFCEKTGMSKTIPTEKILSQYLAEYFSRPEQDRKLFK